VALKNGKVVIVLTVPKGIDKPYFDKNGVIWLRTGADKRRINSKEALRRLFLISDQFHADEEKRQGCGCGKYTIFNHRSACGFFAFICVLRYYAQGVFCASFIRIPHAQI
jgi:hypothetical protein